MKSLSQKEKLRLGPLLPVSLNADCPWERGNPDKVGRAVRGEWRWMALQGAQWIPRAWQF